MPSLPVADYIPLVGDLSPFVALFGSDLIDDISGGGGVEIVIYEHAVENYTIRLVHDIYEIQDKVSGETDYIHNDVEQIYFGAGSVQNLESLWRAASAERAGAIEARNDLFIVPRGGSFSLSLNEIARNDYDPFGLGLVIEQVTSPLRGVTLVLGADGQLRGRLDGDVPDHIELTYQFRAGNGTKGTGVISLYQSTVRDILPALNLPDEAHITELLASISSDCNRALIFTDYGCPIYDGLIDDYIALPDPTIYGLEL